MTLGSLGRLVKVNIRDIWRTEAQDFTPWLAREENLAVLAEALDMELEIEAQERNVGPFRADILCKDLSDNSWVLIENQLERTDHVHLGQLLTYASGLETVTIVWIATSFTEEHRAALDWLNKITDEQFRFFGLEVELWRIGDSLAAPKFNIVSKPNDWSRSVGEAARRIEADTLTETKALQLQFWTELRDALASHRFLRPQKPQPQHWAVFRIGRAGFHIGAILNTRGNEVGVELYISGSDAKAYFNLLRKDQVEIEESLGFTLDWRELPHRRDCRIFRTWDDVDPLDQKRWPEYRQWMISTMEAFHNTFRERIRQLNAADFDPDTSGAA